MTTDQVYQDLLATAVSDFSAGNVEGFSETCKTIVATDGSAPESQFLIGIMAFLTNDPGLAVEKIQSAYDLDDECGTYADVLANLYARLGRLNDSLYYAKLSPTLDEHPILGNLLVSGLDNYMAALSESKLPEFLTEALRAYRKGDFVSAITAAEKELRLDKRDGETYKVLARSYMQVGELVKALSILRSWLHIEKDNLEPRLYLAEVLRGLGRTDQAEACLLAALQTATAADLAKNYDRRFGVVGGVERLSEPDGHPGAPEMLQSTGFDQQKKADDAPLRVGIISDHFIDGAQHALIKPWVDAVKDGLEVYCYHDSDIHDPVTQQLKSKATKWSDIADIDDQTLLYIIDADGLDVLIDFSQAWYHSRESVIAQSNVDICLNMGPTMLTSDKAASHVLGPDGLIATSELPQLDRDQRIAIAAESLALAGLESIEPKPFPVLQIKRVTFGVDFGMAGFDSGLLVTWAALLASYPGSRLVLGNARYAPRDTVEEVCNLFGNFGFLDRLSIASDSGNERGNLDFFDAIDLYLPTPDSLSPSSVMIAARAGRPSLVLCGDEPQGDWVAGAMTAMGQAQGVARTQAEFLAGAKTIITDIEAGAITAQGFAKTTESAPAAQSAEVIEKVSSFLLKARS